MNPFAYSRTADAATAVQQVAGDARAAFVAGGTSLIDLMKLRVESPALLVDINAVPLNKIEATDDGLRVGALVSNTDLAYHESVRKDFPALSEALLSGASPQLRNMASVGGNLMQRTRCYYFRDGISPCSKRDPGSGCAALEGFNRIHAVLGGSDQCIATHPSDMAVALVALDAVVKVRGPKGERSINAIDFHLLPGEHPERETVLEHGELITAVELTALAAGRAVALFEGARPGELRIRPGVGGGRSRNNRRRHPGGAAGARRRGDEAVVRVRGGKGARGAKADGSGLRRRRQDGAARTPSLGSSTGSRSSWRSAPSSAP